MTSQAHGDHRVPVCLRDAYTIFIEHVDLDDGSFVQVLHCNVYKWSKATLHRIGSDFDTLLTLTHAGYYAFVPQGDLKLDKFARLLGFRFATNTSNADGVPGALYRLDIGRKFDIRSK